MTAPHPFVAAVGAALAELGVAGRVPVACSGGGDSLALLRACVELRDAGADLRPVAAHFDHRQRPDSAADAAAVAACCDAWDCGFVAGTFGGGTGASEAALRDARYGWLAAAAAEAGAAWVLTGHTADDRAETVLLRIVRGTGVAGLAGIPAVGPLPGGSAGGVRVARPMLSRTGAAARAFLTHRGARWREDPSNRSPDFARNRVRHEALPLLRIAEPAGGRGAEPPGRPRRGSRRRDRRAGRGAAGRMRCSKPARGGSRCGLVRCSGCPRRRGRRFCGRRGNGPAGRSGGSAGGSGRGWRRCGPGTRRSACPTPCGRPAGRTH